LLQKTTRKATAQIALLVFANPRNTDPKKLKEQFFPNTLDGNEQNKQ
jgi:hypothetical protein